MSKSYTTTNTKLGITEQAVGAVLSSCSCDVGSRLPRSRTDLRDAKSKEVKSEFYFTLNVQALHLMRQRQFFLRTRRFHRRKRNTVFFYVCCRIVDGLLLFIPLRLYLVVATDGKKTSFRAREERRFLPGSERLFWISLMG